MITFGGDDEYLKLGWSVAFFGAGNGHCYEPDSGAEVHVFNRGLGLELSAAYNSNKKSWVACVFTHGILPISDCAGIFHSERFQGFGPGAVSEDIDGHINADVHGMRRLKDLCI